MIDIVVTNYRTPDLLRACVTSIRNTFSSNTADIFTIDTSPPEEQIGDYRIENKGYGQACNYGASLGDNPYVLFMNADTEFTRLSHTQIIIDLFRRDPTIGIIGPKQVNEHGEIVSAGCPPVDTPVGYVIRGWKEIDHGQYTEPNLDCKYVPGSVLFCRRRVFDEVGGFLETPLFYEEAFLCYKARHLGHRVVYCGQSLFLHHWGRSWQQEGIDAPAYSAESYAMFRNACEDEGITDIPEFAG